MAIDIRPRDPGLDQAFQAGQGIVQNNTLSNLTDAVTGMPGAINAMKQRMALAQMMQNGGQIPSGTPVNNPMDAMVLARTQSMMAPEQKMPSDIWSDIAPTVKADPNSEPPTLRQYAAMAKGLQASKTSPTQQMMPPPEAIASWNRQMAKHPDWFPKDMIASRPGSPQFYAQAMGAYNAERQGMDYDPRQSQYDYGQQKHAADVSGGLQGKQFTVLKTAADTVQGNLDEIQRLLPMVSPTDIPKLNEWYRSGLRNVPGDPEGRSNASKLLTLFAGTKDMEAQVLNNGNAPLDIHLKQADSMLGPGIDPTNFQGVRSALMMENNNKLMSFQRNISQNAGGASFVPRLQKPPTPLGGPNDNSIKRGVEMQSDTSPAPTDQELKMTDADLISAVRSKTMTAAKAKMIRRMRQ